MTTNRMTPAVEETVRHLRSLPSIRERVEKVFQRLDRLNYFQVDLSQLPLVVQRVLDLIQRDCQFGCQFALSFIFHLLISLPSFLLLLLLPIRHFSCSSAPAFKMASLQCWRASTHSAVARNSRFCKTQC